MITITRKEDCYGCNACVSRCGEDALKMVEDEEGFPYPKGDADLCIDCGACEAVCPLHHRFDLPPDPAAYACKNPDTRVRMESTSGGSFTALAEAVLARGGVVFGAQFDEAFQVRHGQARTVEELKRFRRSKYSQSVIGDTFVQARDLLDRGVPVLFSGTPCQIAGLRTFLDADPVNLVTVDLICHGVPSPRVYREHVASLQARYREEVRKVDFRDKNRGWKMFSFSVFFEKNLYSQSKRHDLFMRGFLAAYFLRPTCHTCEFKGRNRGSDLTIADYWGVHTRFPEYDDDLGVALVLVNTDKGGRVWADASRKLHVIQSDHDHAVKHNHSYASPVPPHPERAGFFRDLNTRPFDEVMAERCGAPDLLPIESGH